MPRISHLIRRNGIYWFKIDLPDQLAGQRLPTAIPDIFKPLESPSRRGHLKTAIWLSLRTTAELEAKQRLGVQIAHYARLFERTRAFLSEGSLLTETDDPSHDDALIQATPTGWTRPASPVVLPVPSSIPVRPAAILSATDNANAADWTITKAFRSWSMGGGAKGVKKPAPNTIIEAEAARRRFVELFGDLPVHHIGKGHGREYRDAISEIPKGLPADLKQLPLKELLERDLSAYEPRSATTINKSLTLLGAILGRAEQDRHFDGTGWRNPFDVAFEVDPADEDYYEPFNKDELNRLIPARCSLLVSVLSAVAVRLRSGHRCLRCFKVPVELR
jgi:hypothetical protein